MSLIVAIILTLAVLILAVAIATTKVITLPTEFIIDGQYTILDDTPLLEEG